MGNNPSFCEHCGQWFDHEPVKHREATFCSPQCITAILLLCEQEKRKLIDASSQMRKQPLRNPSSTHPHDSV